MRLTRRGASCFERHISLIFKTTSVTLFAIPDTLNHKYHFNGEVGIVTSIVSLSDAMLLPTFMEPSSSVTKVCSPEECCWLSSYNALIRDVSTTVERDTWA